MSFDDVPFLSTLKINGNPSLRMTDPTSTDRTLPNWLQLDTKLVKLNANDLHTCASLKSADGKTLSFEFDPSWYDYAYCECDFGI